MTDTKTQAIALICEHGDFEYATASKAVGLLVDNGFVLERKDAPAPSHIVTGTWLPIERADKTITDVQEFLEIGMTIKMSDRYWVRDDDGRVYEAAWSEGEKGRSYWWDFEGESPVNPVEFMPHPLDPRFHPDAKLED